MIESVLRRFYEKGESRKIASLIRNNPQIAGMWCCIFATRRGFPATSVRFYAAKENSSWQGFLSYWYYIRKNSLWWNGVGWGRKAWCKNATPKNSILWKKYFKNSLHKLILYFTNFILKIYQCSGLPISIITSNTSSIFLSRVCWLYRIFWY